MNYDSINNNTNDNPQVYSKPSTKGNYRKTTQLFSTTLDNYSINIPNDFLYDGASIPRVFWAITGGSFYSLYDTPACVHDYLYRDNSGPNKDVTRKEADVIFKRLLQRNGVSRFKSKLFYLSVRVFGAFSWKKKRVDWDV